ncbi:MAG: nickel pincer cofactor biosynthesis protein LarB [Planctomycetota bacterium]|jgi:NCAIR mutase (PurE)-related protein
MDRRTILDLLAEVRAGVTDLDEAADRLAHLPFDDIGFARVDTHRELRCGFPEVVFCAGKTPDEVRSIAERLLSDGDRLLATRADPSIHEAVREAAPDAIWHERARAITVNRGEAPAVGLVTVLCAGTADIPVAEEARVTAEMVGARTETLYDCGVAGLHRLLADHDRMRNANALVVVAGMEGALASVVGGLVDRPVIAVPTSIGYGASFGGIAPLLTMLNSCVAGVTVVNIDNGFGGGYAAALINRLAAGDGE